MGVHEVTSMIIKYRKWIIAFYLLLIPLSIYQLFNLKFSFDFEQFFPQGDPDLEFFQEFIEEFETDDNFLLIAVEHEPTVFDQDFLKQFHQFSLAAKRLTFVEQAQSLTTLSIPIKTPFGYNAVPMIHIDDESKYATDQKNILADKRFKNTLINEDTDALVLNLQTKGFLQLEESNILMEKVDSLIGVYGFEDVHILGRAYFQDQLVAMQKTEILKSSIIAILLVTLIMILIYRRAVSIMIAIGSISLSLLFFMGLLGMLGRELNLMSALYPILMLIVGTSDVIHIMSKYIDELKKGSDKSAAMKVTMRQIGVATLLTSLTTAVGFATLLTSNIAPIQGFGINAAMGVILAYIVVITLTTSVLTLFDINQLIPPNKLGGNWDRFLERWYTITRHHEKAILMVSSIMVILFFIGMTRISTDYKIESNLPEHASITEDFRYFEDKFSGFRPLEFAITSLDPSHPSDGYEVLKEVDKLEDYLNNHPLINSAIGLTSIYKSIEKANKRNNPLAYRFPDNEKDFKKSKRLLAKLSKKEVNSFVNNDRTKTRISARMKDAGAKTIKEEGLKMDQWITENLDNSIISVKRTGTGIIIDKNSEFIKEDLIQGLLIALVLVSLLMAFLFKNLRLLIIALIPNIIPVLFAASLLGYIGIELEAGVSIIFAIVFGIAVDDTIHFLSKYKLTRDQGMDVETALKTTFLETGKAITFTTIILFFGFLVMLFSNHPPSFTVGLLISITLIGAWICDLFLLPVIMRRMLKS